MVTWEDWETRPVVVQMVRFTGFGPDGNGDELLVDLNERGVFADHDPEHLDRIRINTREREEAIVRVGDYIVHGTRDEYYPIEPPVQHDKYQRPAS